VFNIYIDSIQPGYVHRICGSDAASQCISHAKSQAFDGLICGWVNAVEQDMWEFEQFCYQGKGIIKKGSKTMRKLISLGLLTLLLSVFAGPVMAGGAEDCDKELLDGDYTKGLYGLCIAYWSGNADKTKFLEKYNSRMKAGEGDPTMPGMDEGVDLDSCPCWTFDNLAAAKGFDDPAICGTDDFGGGRTLDFAEYGGPLPTVLFEAGWIFFGAVEGCVHADPNGGMPAMVDNVVVFPEDIQSCRDGIAALVLEDFDGSCD
jgi:hypothetical protein